MLTVLGPGKSQVLADLMSGQGLLLVSQTALFFLYPYTAKMERELSEISFLRALIPFMKRIIDYAEVVIISVMPGKRQVLVLL